MAYFIFYLFTFFMFHEMDAVNHKDGRVIDFKNILLFLPFNLFFPSLHRNKNKSGEQKERNEVIKEKN